MNKIDILIIHLNGEKILRNCLQSIFFDNPEASVHLLFNATEDDSVRIVKKYFPKVKSYFSRERLGFAEASNYLARKSNADYIVFLNNDTVVKKDWLNNMKKTIENNRNCVACQPKVISYKNPKYFEYAGAAGGLIDMYGFPFCRGRIFENVEKNTGQFEKEEVIFWACGVCMMIKREVFFKVGCFDERLFMYGEEIDLCWRLNNLGKDILFCPNAEIRHIGSYSIKKEKINFMKEYLITRNHLLLFLKNYSVITLVRLLPARLFLEILAALAFPAKKGLPLILSLISVPAIYTFDSIKKKRKFNKIRKVSDSVVNKKIFRKSIALEYYLKNKKRYSEL